MTAVTSDVNSSINIYSYKLAPLLYEPLYGEVVMCVMSDYVLCYCTEFNSPWRYNIY
jgi:hypothetical protein